MRHRYNFLKFTIGRWKRKSMAEVNRDMNIKFTKAEILALVCMALIFLAIYIPHEVASGIIALIAMACYVVATVWDCFNYGPITRWRHATIKSAIGAMLWTVMPIIIYYSGEGTAEDYKEMLYISLSSIIMWIAVGISIYKWVTARRDARARAAVIAMRISTRRKTLY